MRLRVHLLLLCAGLVGSVVVPAAISLVSGRPAMAVDRLSMLSDVLILPISFTPLLATGIYGVYVAARMTKRVWQLLGDTLAGRAAAVIATLVLWGDLSLALFVALLLVLSIWN